MLIISLSAQAPQAFKYQTVVRTLGGEIVKNTDVYFRISILQGSSSGTEVYKETFSLTTNEFGLAAFNIGQGSVESGSFSTISWSSYEFWVKVELDIDAAGSAPYEEVGTSQLISVPYALTAKTAENAYWIKTGNNLYYNEGKVGVGSATPFYTLDIAGSNQYGITAIKETTLPHTGVHESILLVQNASNVATSQANIMFQAGSPAHGRAIISATHDISEGLYDGNLDFKVRNGAGIDNPTNYITALTLRSSGNVGINETEPDATLHVGGDAHVTGNMVVDGQITIPDPIENTDAVNKAFVDNMITKVTGLVLWNKLGSSEEIQNSEIGLNGTIIGSDYAFETAKYGTGYVRKAIGSNYVSFPQTILQNLKRRGTVELWVNPKVTNPVAFSYGVFPLFGNTFGTNSHVYIAWGDGTSGVGFYGSVNFDGTGHQTEPYESQYVATIGVPFHVAICWDVEGIDGTSNTVRVYRNGTLINTSDATWDANDTTHNYDGCTLGMGPDSGGYDKYIVDNIKVWNYAKTNFSDRFKE